MLGLHYLAHSFLLIIGRVDFLQKKMKKLALIFIAVAFGSGVSFAQTTSKTSAKASEEKSVHSLTFDRMSNTVDEKEASVNRQALSIYELPDVVQEQLMYSELGGHTIVSITEIQPPFGHKATLQYELVLKDSEANAKNEPNLIVRFDEYGELISQKKAPVL